jgi:hypothetical protein
LLYDIGAKLVGLYLIKVHLKWAYFGKGVIYGKESVLGVIAIIVMMSFAFISCNGNGKGSLSGTWETEELGFKMTWNFTGNKLTQEMIGIKTTIPYTIKKGAIAMVYEGLEVEYKYKIEGNTLTVLMGLGTSLNFKRVDK